MFVERETDPLLGQTIAGRYDVVRLIDRGGMGAIYEVVHRGLSCGFAMKTLAPGLLGHPEAIARFRREAEIVAALRHPHIISVVDWDQLPDGSPCMVMDLLRGEDLCRRLDRGTTMCWATIRRIADQVLSAVAVAHGAGVVHRDLKPQNGRLLFEPDRTRGGCHAQAGAPVRVE